MTREPVNRLMLAKVPFTWPLDLSIGELVGRLLHGVMSSLAEYYSANLSTEVLKGMTEKARLGGTPTRAPIGYIKTRVIDHLGREIRDVGVDPERGKLITWAFETFATGDWSINQLVDELALRGLTTLPTPKRPAKPVTRNGVHTMLTNRYYIGTVLFAGVEYDGKHKHLTTAETFDRVQEILRGRNQSTARYNVYDHYLKGSVYCGSCGSHLTVTRAKNRHGNVYMYFMCRGRAGKTTTCSRQVMKVETVEELVEDLYAKVQIDEPTREQIRARLHTEMAKISAEAEQLRTSLNRQRHGLLDERTKLLQAHYAGAVPLEVLKEEQERIAATLAGIEQRMAVGGEQADAATANLDAILDLTADCQAAYRDADPVIRRLFNQAFFTHIYIDEDDTAMVNLTEPLEAVLR